MFIVSGATVGEDLVRSETVICSCNYSRSSGCCGKIMVITVNIFSESEFACLQCSRDPGDIFNRKFAFDLSCVKKKSSRFR